MLALTCSVLPAVAAFPLLFGAAQPAAVAPAGVELRAADTDWTFPGVDVQLVCPGRKTQTLRINEQGRLELEAGVDYKGCVVGLAYAGRVYSYAIGQGAKGMENGVVRRICG